MSFGMKQNFDRVEYKQIVFWLCSRRQPRTRGRNISLQTRRPQSPPRCQWITVHMRRVFPGSVHKSIYPDKKQSCKLVNQVIQIVFSSLNKKKPRNLFTVWFKQRSNNAKHLTMTDLVHTLQNCLWSAHIPTAQMCSKFRQQTLRFSSDWTGATYVTLGVMLNFDPPPRNFLERFLLELAWQKVKMSHALIVALYCCLVYLCVEGKRLLLTGVWSDWRVCLVKCLFCLHMWYILSHLATSNFNFDFWDVWVFFHCNRMKSNHFFEGDKEKPFNSNVM